MIDHFKENAEKSAKWIQTYHGIKYVFTDPHISDIDIGDISVSLSRQARYTGHTNKFYSVGEHSVRVARLLIAKYPDKPDLARWGLLHDAAEAYISDIVSPLKHYLIGWKGIEEDCNKVIAKKFGLTLPIPKEVAEADYILLATEKRDLMDPEAGSWGKLPEPLPGHIHTMTMEEAQDEFQELFEELFAYEIEQDQSFGISPKRRIRK